MTPRRYELTDEIPRTHPGLGIVSSVLVVRRTLVGVALRRWCDANTPTARERDLLWRSKASRGTALYTAVRCTVPPDVPFQFGCRMIGGQK